MALLLCIWVAILIPFNGSLTFRDRSGEGYHAGAIMLLYVAGGAATGAIVGALRPLLRWPVGAALVGMIAAVPLGVGFNMARIGFASWDRLEIMTVVVWAIAFGGGGGLIIRAFVGNAEKRQ